LEIEHQELNRQRDQLQLERRRLEQAANVLGQIDSVPDRPTIRTASIIADSRHVNDLQQRDETAATTGDDALPPRSDEDVFARLRAMALLKDSDGQTQPECAEHQPLDELRQVDSLEASTADELVEQDTTALSEVTPVTAEHRAGGHEEDVSIDDYMAKLLERMRGSADESPPPVSRSAKSTADQAGNSSAAKSDPTPVQPQAERPPVASTLTYLEPRKAAPENTRDLAAMREIANLSSRSAIATHHHRNRADRALGTLAVGAVGLVCGVLLLWWSPDFASPFFFAGLLGLGVAAFWFIKSGILAQHVKKLKGHYRQQMKSFGDEQQEQPAISTEVPADTGRVDP
jgi:hypothetical protein